MGKESWSIDLPIPTSFWLRTAARGFEFSATSSLHTEKGVAAKESPEAKRLQMLMEVWPVHSRDKLHHTLVLNHWMSAYALFSLSFLLFFLIILFNTMMLHIPSILSGTFLWCLRLDPLPPGNICVTPWWLGLWYRRG